VIVTTDGRAETVDESGLPLGIVDDEVYEEICLETPRKASIVVYSDGITEAVAPDGTMYGGERLKRCLQEHATEGCGAEDLRQRILDDLGSFRKGEVRNDDLTVLVVRRTDG
jgi:phosphoserine phosphatase RsbU/P